MPGKRRAPGAPPGTDDSSESPTPVDTGRQDWESLALSRVARRLDALASAADAERRDGSAGYGWEDVALAHLRRRLRTPDER